MTHYSVSIPDQKIKRSRFAVGKTSGSLYFVLEHNAFHNTSTPLKCIALIGRGSVPTGSEQWLEDSELLPFNTTISITV